MALDLSTLTTEQQLAAIYIGYYDRAADPLGEDFWEGAAANPNLSLADIATDFATQPETLIAYPFLNEPTAEQANAFLSEVYLNLFNRAPDQAGLEFWGEALLAAIDGTGTLTVGEIILSIIEGAQDSAEGNDRATILNKIEVATTWTDAADAAAIDYTSNTSAQNSAKSIIEGVTDEASTVVAAKQAIDGFFVPAPVPGDTFLLTSATDVMTGTADDDEFLAYIQQNPFAGGISNSLSSADRLDGGAGNDRLYAELTSEIIGVSFTDATDIQPRITNIEKIDIEARDAAFGDNDIVVDAKNINGHNEIGSYYSDGDLFIENLTTLTAGGTARNTSEITVTMDHTDNFNSDGDASDLIVYFDNDYLLSGQEAQGQIFYFLLDQDAEEDGLEDRLFNIDVDGIRFTIDTGNGPQDVTIEDPAANVAGTHQGFVNALQPALQALIADGTLPAGTTLTLDPTITDFTFLDDGSRSDDIPAIVLTSGDGSEVIATGYTRIEEPIGEYNVYGRFRSENEVEDQPISIDIDLHKTGRGGEGGDLIIGGKDTETADGIADGIEVFNINVLGAGNDDPNGGMTKPSDLGTITSTGNALRQVFIATDPVFAAGDSYASLTVRNGFDQNTTADVESGDLQLINADAFLGDLTLGEISTTANPVTNPGRITNADTITAQGGGNVSLALLYDGNETDQAYSVTTGGGNDTIDIRLDGDALDYAGSSLNVSTGGGDDKVTVAFEFDAENNNNNQLNQAILDSVTIETGDGNDEIRVDGVGVANINAGAGNDVIYSDGAGAKAIWALNFDNARVDAQDLNFASNPVGTPAVIAADDLPGVQTSLAYIGGATITVTLSGAGLGAAPVAGGGVMADGTSAPGAIAFNDGFESRVTIESLINGNTHYGDQRDINAAIVKAINDDPVLSKLLTATIQSNNTLTITSKTSGAFAPEDLRIDIAQSNKGTNASDWTAVQTEAQTVFNDSSIVITNLLTTNTNTNPNYRAADLDDSVSANRWYDGLSAPAGAALANNSMADNLHTAGAADMTENDNVIDGGAGDDVIVLSTDAIPAATTALTVSSQNALINGASNETIKLTGSNFGNDTVMNFTTAGPGFTAPTAGAAATLVAGYEGMDFLDFTAYLTSLTDRSTGTADSTASNVPFATTLDFGTDAGTAGATAANEVVVVRMTNGTGTEAAETFAALSASNIAALYNNTVGGDNAYGDLAQASFTGATYSKAGPNEQLIGNAKAVLMVENAANHGEYKVFELTWAGDNASGANNTVSAVALGSLDFGDSLTGLAAANLVGSADYSALLAAGLSGGGVVPPVTPPVTPPPTGTPVTIAVTEAGTFDAAPQDTTFDVADGTFAFTINNFAAGDKLDFSDVAGATTATFNVLTDADQTDGQQQFQAIDPNDGSTVTVTLVGLTAAQDAALFNQGSVDAVFGAGTLIF